MTILKNNLNDVAVVILAAGEGKRMKSDLPKVIHKLHGKPLIEYVVEAVEKAGVAKLFVIVSPKNEQRISAILKERAKYIVQDEQLGTGHAVMAARDALQGLAEHVLVLPGDLPNVTPEVIRQLIDKQMASSAVLTIATATVNDFKGSNSVFNDYGRIIRDSQGALVKIVEYKDASRAEAATTELNTLWFCFKSGWLWEHLEKLENNNLQKEYYLVDLVGMAIMEGKQVATIATEPRSALGVNTPEQLVSLNNLKS